MRAAMTILVVVVLLTVAAVLLFGWRLRVIAARVGSFQCALRAGSRWLPGVATYTRDQLVWYQVVSLSRRPRHRWDRDELMILRREFRDDLPRAGTVVEAHCVHRGELLDLAAEPAAFDGLVSWLEASPPGARSSGVI